MESNKYEKALKENREFPSKLAALISDTSNKIGLLGKGMSPHHQTIWDTSSFVIGPIFSLYVSWLLKEAKSIGLKRLYFVSRDGQILWKIAKIVGKKRGYDFDLRYLYISRQSLFLPSITGKVKNKLDWIKKRELISISIQEICQRVDIQPILIKAELEKYGFSENAWDKKLNNREIKKMRKCFQEQSIQKIINGNEKKALKHTLGYLKREKIADDNLNYGIVDIGWTGKSVESLNIILQKNGFGDDISLKGFYFGLWSEIKSKNRIIPFIQSSQFLKLLKYMNNRVIVEIFASTDHGMVTGYKKEKDRYLPILSSLGVKETRKWGIAIQQKSILKFAEQFTDAVNLNRIPHRDSESIAGKLLNDFLSNPSHEEADVYGKFYFSEKEIEDDFQELAPPVTSRQILLWVMGLGKMEKNFFFWLNGSLKRSEIKHSWILLFLIKVKLRIKKINFLTVWIWIKIGLIKTAKFLFPGLVKEIKKRFDWTS